MSHFAPCLTRFAVVLPVTRRSELHRPRVPAQPRYPGQTSIAVERPCLA
jgi:hypothetical protein